MLLLQRRKNNNNNNNNNNNTNNKAITPTAVVATAPSHTRTSISMIGVPWYTRPVWVTVTARLTYRCRLYTQRKDTRAPC